tara:strand:+ start:380 stop:481 length:102 start_codon:yes stop_codon:yes gene_type:complete
MVPLDTACTLCFASVLTAGQERSWLEFGARRLG